jgi:hypothetical protein
MNFQHFDRGKGDEKWGGMIGNSEKIIDWGRVYHTIFLYDSFLAESIQRLIEKNKGVR